MLCHDTNSNISSMISSAKSDRIEKYVQVASLNNEGSHEKAILLPVKNTFSQHGLIKTNCLQQDQVEKNQSIIISHWHFHESCTAWRKNMAPVSKISPHLSSINCLRFEGFYSYQHRYWQRYFVTTDGIVISLMEDIPESGGQNCLWAAGLVMGR